MDVVKRRFHAGDFNTNRWCKIAENLFQALPDLVVVEGFASVLDHKNDVIVQAVDNMVASVEIIFCFSGNFNTSKIYWMSLPCLTISL